MVISNKAQTDLVFPWFLYLFIATVATNNYWNTSVFVLLLLLHISQLLPLSDCTILFYALTLH